MTAIPPYYYRRLSANTFETSINCAGPWSKKLQHGGPPLALIASALQKAGAGVGCPFVSRLSCLLMKPLPLVPIKIDVSPIRTGRAVAHFEVSLKDLQKDDEIFRVIGLCTRVEDFTDKGLEKPPETEPALPALPPFKGEITGGFPDGFGNGVGYVKSVELCKVKGGIAQGASTYWMRPKYPLVEGEEITDLERLVICADSAGGISWFINPIDTTFLNADMTLNFQRPVDLKDGWVCMDSQTTLSEKTGTGLVRGTLFDQHGAVCYLNQNQLLQSQL